MKIIIYLVLGIAVCIGAFCLIGAAGHTILGILAGLVMAVGIGLIGLALSIALDKKDPTYRKL